MSFPSPGLLPCGVPGLLNADFERMFGVTMSTVRKRSAQVDRALEIQAEPVVATSGLPPRHGLPRRAGNRSLHMSDWIFDRHGQATLLLDNDCIRDQSGQVIAWIVGANVYTLQGGHCGWFEEGVLRDSQNCVLGFVRDATGLPSRPGIGGTPGKPGFAGRPGRPGLGGTPGRPGRGGWSSLDLASYFGC
jgi:hypothetical protein